VSTYMPHARGHRACICCVGCVLYGTYEDVFVGAPALLNGSTHQAIRVQHLTTHTHTRSQSNTHTGHPRTTLSTSGSRIGGSRAWV
jgi:hypothetical protein